ncbi:HTH-type transcriptional regulator SgrR [compost metagenome]
MLTAERYITLQNHYVGPGASESEEQEYEASLEELTGLFHCTERNVKMIVKKLQEEELIKWLPGLGRGNRSRIQFMVKRESFLLKFAQQLAVRGDYQDAFEFLHSYEEDNHILDQFIKWLNEQFGVKQLSVDHKDKDVFHLPVYRTIYSLDPGNLFFGFDSHIVRQIFDRLVHYDSDKGQIVPMLAHYWEANEDGTEWTFHLRKGITFHHGRVLTSEDVLFTLNRVRDSQTNRWILETIRHIEALDDRTVKIFLQQPNWLLPRLLCSSCVSILPEDLLTQDEPSFWSQPSGTGPFRVVKWCDNSMELTVNESYFLGRAYLDGVKIVFLPENIPNKSKVKWENLINNDARVPSQAGGDWELIETLSKSCLLISWNRNKSGPQQSLAFRQAVNLIIDRSGMIDHSGQQGYPARSFLPKEDTSYGIHRHDEEAAKKLLQESGYDGSPISLLTTEGDCINAQWIQKQCALIGIPVELTYTGKNALSKTGTAQDADSVLICLLFADDEICEMESFQQENSIIHQHLEPGLHNWINSIFKEIYASRSEEKRRVLLQQIEYRLHDEAQVLFLLHRKMNTYVHPSVRGLVINNLGWMDFKDIWLTSSLTAKKA